MYCCCYDIVKIHTHTHTYICVCLNAFVWCYTPAECIFKNDCARQRYGCGTGVACIVEKTNDDESASVRDFPGRFDFKRRRRAVYARLPSATMRPLL